MPRRAKEEPFSKCRSATMRRLSSCHQRAPSGAASKTTPRTGTSVGPAAGRIPRSIDSLWSIVAHSFADEVVRRLPQYVFPRFAADRLATDLQHDRHGERGNPIEPLMHDSPADAGEHRAEPSNVEKAAGGIGPGRLQENVVGFMAAEHVVDEIGRDGDLAARLLLAGVALLDQP